MAKLLKGCVSNQSKEMRLSPKQWGWQKWKNNGQQVLPQSDFGFFYWPQGWQWLRLKHVCIEMMNQYIYTLVRGPGQTNIQDLHSQWPSECLVAHLKSANRETFVIRVSKFNWILNCVRNVNFILWYVRVHVINPSGLLGDCQVFRRCFLPLLCLASSMHDLVRRKKVSFKMRISFHHVFPSCHFHLRGILYRGTVMNDQAFFLL